MPKEMAEVSEKCQGGKRFYEWLWSGLDADDTKQEFIGVVPNIGLGASLTKSIKALRSTPIWLEKATTGIAKRFVDCMTGMCKTQGYVTRGNFACCEVLAFGAAEVHIAVKGSECIAGVALPNDVSYKAFVESLDQKPGQELAALAKLGVNFMFEAKVGDVCILPSGFQYLLYSPAGATVIRKSISPPHDGEDAVVKCTTAMVLECHPSLQTSTWNDWHGFLSGQTE